MKGTMKHAKTSFSTEVCAGAMISVVQYLAPLRYSIFSKMICLPPAVVQTHTKKLAMHATSIYIACHASIVFGRQALCKLALGVQENHKCL
jgi:hypothetical protein